MTNDEKQMRGPHRCVIRGHLFRHSNFVIRHCFIIRDFVIRNSTGAGSQFELGVITVPANPARRVPQFPAALRAGSPAGLFPGRSG